MELSAHGEMLIHMGMYDYPSWFRASCTSRRRFERYFCRGNCRYRKRDCLSNVSLGHNRPGGGRTFWSRCSMSRIRRSLQRLKMKMLV